MKALNWILKHNWITTLILSIIISCVLFYSIFNVQMEYPEDEFQQLEDFMHKYVDTDNKVINYSLKVPEGITLGFREEKPSIIVTKEYSYTTISYTASFLEPNNPKFYRSDNSKEELNQHYRNFGMIIAAFTFIISLLAIKMIFKIIVFFFGYYDSDDLYVSIRNSYIRAGENAKKLKSK